MSVTPDREAKLERLVAQALGRQALLPAPAELQTRVLAEIERRAQLPWWQRRVASWPQGMRLALGAGAGLLSVGALRAFAVQLQGALSASTAPLLLHVRHAGQLLLALGHAGASLLAAIPSQYVYAGIALTATAYVVVFAMAALGYRVLTLGTPYSQPASSR